MHPKLRIIIFFKSLISTNYPKSSRDTRPPCPPKKQKTILNFSNTLMMYSCPSLRLQSPLKLFHKQHYIWPKPYKFPSLFFVKYKNILHKINHNVTNSLHLCIIFHYIPNLTRKSISPF